MGPAHSKMIVPWVRELDFLFRYGLGVTLMFPQLKKNEGDNDILLYELS